MEILTENQVSEKSIKLKTPQGSSFLDKYGLNDIYSSIVNDQRFVLQIIKYLTLEESKVFEEINESGIIPRLVELLKTSNDLFVILDICSIIIKFTESSPQITKAVVDAGVIPALVFHFRVGQSQLVQKSVLEALQNISVDSTEQSEDILNAGVLELLYNLLENSTDIELIKLGVELLANLSRCQSSPVLKECGIFLPTLGRLITHEDDRIVNRACFTLANLTLTFRMHNLIEYIIEAGFFPRLVELLDKRPIDPTTGYALTIFGILATDYFYNFQAIIDCNALPAFRRLIESTRDDRLIFYISKTLSNIACGTTNQTQAIVDADIFPFLLLNILLSDDPETDKSATIELFHKVSSAATDAQIQHFVDIGCILAMCKLIKLEDISIVKIALDVLENIVRCGGMEYGSRVAFIGGEDVLEEIISLQSHVDVEVYDRVYAILRKYFM